MSSKGSVPLGRFPMRFLTAAVILTAIALAWLSWGTYSSYQITKVAMQPVAVGNAHQAISVLRQSYEAEARVPLVLSDVNMPEVDGLTLTEWIRQDPNLRTTDTESARCTHCRSSADCC